MPVKGLGKNPDETPKPESGLTRVENDETSQDQLGQMNTTVHKPLEQRIKDYLQQQQAGKAAAQIVKHIGHCDKKSVNAVLYQLEKQGVVTKKLQGWKPMWSLANKSWPRGWDGGFHGHPSGQWHGSYRGSHQFQGRHFPAQPRHFRAQPFQIQQGRPLLTDPVQGRPSQTPQVQWRTFPAQPHGQIPHCNGPPFPNTFQGPRGRGRGRGWDRGRGGAAGRGGDRGRARRRSSASSSTGFWSNQKTQRKPPEASSDQRGPKFGDRKFKDRASSSTGGTSAGLNGNVCMGNVASLPAPHDSVSSSSVAKQVDAQQYFMNQMSALNSAVSQTGVESTALSTTGALDTTSTAATDVNSVGTGGALKDRGSDADTNDSLDLEDDDEMDEDCHANFETSAFTTRFQDMMGTLTFNDPVFSAEEELMEEEEPSMAWSSSDLILRLLSMAPDQAMTLTELAEALMKPEEELASDLAECGDKVDVRDGKCSLTAKGKMWAEERPESCQSVESDSKPKPEQGSSLMPAGPISTSTSGPPKPPKEWIQSQTALVTKNETSTTHSGVPAEGRLAIDSDPSTALLPLMRARSFGRGQDLLAFVDRKPPPGQAGRGGITVSGSPPGQAGRGGNTVSGSPPGQAGRGGNTVSGSPPGQAGRGGNTVSGSPPGQAGRGGGTVSGSHDVREVESNYFSTATSQTSPATSSTVTLVAAEKTGQSSSHTDFMFRAMDEIPWKPLMSSPETPVDRNVQSSVLSPSSQSSPAGQTPQGPMPWGSDTSEMPQLSSPHKSASSRVVPVASDVVPYTSVPDPGAVSSLSAQAERPWMGQSPNSLHPRLQKFAAEGLTLVPASMSSVCSAEKTSTCPASSGTFQKPLTPKELVELETPWHGAASQASGTPQSSSVLPPAASSPSLPHSRSTPVISSIGSTSLPLWGGSEEELAGPATLQITSESFAALNKNPISALMEYAQSRHATATIEMVSQRGPSHRPVFVMAAKVGNRLFTRITCHNKKDGKKEAADVALRTLIAEGQLCPATPSPSDNIAPENMTHFDKMAALTHQAFNALIASIPENLAGRKVIAGLVMKRNPQDLGIVVSLGTGNRCITGDKLSLEGNTVNDSHAEIITRRGFMRFLYQELLKYEEGKPHDLFERGAGGKLRVKNGVTFHLYISTAPCGDGALFSPRDTQSNSGATVDTDRREHCPTFTSNVQGLLRTKMEGGEGTIPVDSKDITMQTWDGVVRGERLRTMSCTDKICRWNVLGLQGALLSHFLEPVYLDSLTLGFLYDHGHLSRAVCCRLAREEPRLEQDLSPGFRLNHPWLGRVTACQPLRETQKTKAFSINWVIGDPAPEVLDGTVGHCYTAVEKKLFSRLTKRILYDSFRQVAQHLGRSDLCQATSYHQAKMAATAFQTSKAAMFRKFQQTGCGWVKKPLEEEMFS